MSKHVNAKSTGKRWSQWKINCLFHKISHLITAKTFLLRVADGVNHKRFSRDCISRHLASWMGAQEHGKLTGTLPAGMRGQPDVVGIISNHSDESNETEKIQPNAGKELGNSRLAVMGTIRPLLSLRTSLFVSVMETVLCGIVPHCNSAVWSFPVLQMCFSCWTLHDLLLSWKPLLSLFLLAGWLFATRLYHLYHRTYWRALHLTNTSGTRLKPNINISKINVENRCVASYFCTNGNIFFSAFLEE